MKKRYFLIIILLLLLFPQFLYSAENSCPINPNDRYPIMHPDRETMEKWIEQYNKAPKAKINYELKVIKGSFSLLNHLQYNAGERNQNKCGNCWAWAGTGCLEVALDVQQSIKNRLSVQYINSCENYSSGRCLGGTLTNFAKFYNDTKKAIPWSNSNANWQDGNWPSSGPSCSIISTNPNYKINSINDETITTHAISQSSAISNIKNVLNQGKAIWFAFYLPDINAWNDFHDFWDYQNESTVYNIDKFSGQPYNSVTGGGHAVLCVGYNDDDPNNSYWIILNSWGTPSGRPNGLFRINMDMDYSGYNSNYYSFYWQSLAVQYYSEGIALNSFSLSDRTSGSTDYTKEREVNVSVSATGSPTQICFAKYSDCSGGSWYPYSSGMTDTLPEGDGSKTVYCRVKNSSGVESNILSDTIILDTETPTVNFTLNNSVLRSGDFISASPSVKAIITENIGIDANTIKILRDGSQITDGSSGGGKYDNYDSETKTVTYTIKSALSDGSHSLGFEVKDLAGNTASLNFTNLLISNSLALEQIMNFPNPFNESTSFSYQLSKEANVTIKVYSVRGGLVKTLAAAAGGPGGKLGFNKIGWNGTDEGGASLPNGIYLYLISAQDDQGTRIIKRSKVGILK